MTSFEDWAKATLGTESEEPAPTPSFEEWASSVVDDDRGQFSRGLTAGIDQTQGLLYGAAGLAGDLTGIDSLSDWGREGYLRNMEEASMNAPEVRFTEIEGLGDAGTWAAYTLGNLLPTMATLAGTGGIGGLAGRYAVRKGVQQAFLAAEKQALARGMGAAAAREAGKKAASKAAGTAINIGAGAGAGAGSTAIEGGGIHQEIISETGENRPGVALGFGAIAGAFDAVPVMALLHRMGVGKAAITDITKKLVEDGLIKRVGKGAGIQAVFEGSTEMFQEIVNKAALHWVDNNREIFTPENWQEFIEAAAAGTLMGVTMGGVGGVFKPASPGLDVEDEDSPDQALGSMAEYRRKLETGEGLDVREEPIYDIELEGRKSSEDPGDRAFAHAQGEMRESVRRDMARLGQPDFPLGGDGSDGEGGGPAVEVPRAPDESIEIEGVRPSTEGIEVAGEPIDLPGPDPEGIEVEEIDETRPGTEGFDVTEIGPGDMASWEAARSEETSEAQRKAGNYKKGHYRVPGQNVELSFENAPGDERRGQPQTFPYGYQRGTMGLDGEPIDVYVGPGIEDSSLPVYVIFQKDPESGMLDEEKVMMGFPSQVVAEAAYLSNYSQDWLGKQGGSLDVQKMSWDQYKKWAKKVTRQRKDTPEQAAARSEAASVRARGGGLDPTRDSMDTAVAKLGGLNLESLGGDLDEGLIFVETARGRRPKLGKGTLLPIVRKTDGLTPDAMAEALSQFGYPVFNEEGGYDPNVMLEALNRAAHGEEIISTYRDLSDLEAERDEYYANQEEQALEDFWREAAEEMEAGSAEETLSETEQAIRDLIPAAQAIDDDATVAALEIESLDDALAALRRIVDERAEVPQDSQAVPGEDQGPAQQAVPARGTGTLTEAQKREIVVDRMEDAGKASVKSDLTGKRIRYHITTNEGQVAHPREAYPEITPAEFKRLLKQRQEVKAPGRKNYNETTMLTTMKRLRAATPGEADMLFDETFKTGERALKIKPEDTVLLQDTSTGEYLRAHKDVADTWIEVAQRRDGATLVKREPKARRRGEQQAELLPAPTTSEQISERRRQRDEAAAKAPPMDEGEGDLFRPSDAKKQTALDLAPGETLTFVTEAGQHVGAVASIEDAQEKWQRYIEEVELKTGQGGVSGIGNGGVIMKDGKPVARISYNGRVWDMDGNPIRSKKRIGSSDMTVGDSRRLLTVGPRNNVKTGEAVTFAYAHNPESATKIFGKPTKDSPFFRGYEPAGKYLTALDSVPDGNDALPGHEYGEVTFNNPLVVQNEQGAWKKALSDQYGGKTGKKLSQALLKAGYDGVITIEEKGYISEVLDLRSFDASRAQYHQVYHASPHRFTRFNVEKIGSGQGAQSFGWGLYVAEEEEVGYTYLQSFRGGQDRAWVYNGKVFQEDHWQDLEDAMVADGLAREDATHLLNFVLIDRMHPARAADELISYTDRYVDRSKRAKLENDKVKKASRRLQRAPRDFTVVLKEEPATMSEEEQGALFELQGQVYLRKNSPIGALEHAIQDFQGYRDNYQQRLAEGKMGPERRGVVERELVHTERVLALVDEYHDQFVLVDPPQPAFYEVELDDKAVPKMLDWDAPVGPRAREIAETAMGEEYTYETEYNLNAPPEEWTGEELYRALTRYASENPLPGQADTTGDYRRDASEYLASIGIPGIKFLDQYSRHGRDGKVNSIKRDKDGKWQAAVTYYLPREQQSDFKVSPKFDTEKEARDWADEQGAGGTRNYVVFDDKLLTITRRDGQPITAEEREDVVEGLENPHQVKADPMVTERGDFLKPEWVRDGTVNDVRAFSSQLWNRHRDKFRIDDDRVPMVMEVHQEAGVRLQEVSRQPIDVQEEMLSALEKLIARGFPEQIIERATLIGIYSEDSTRTGIFAYNLTDPGETPFRLVGFSREMLTKAMNGSEKWRAITYNTLAHEFTHAADSLEVRSDSRRYYSQGSPLFKFEPDALEWSHEGGGSGRLDMNQLGPVLKEMITAWATDAEGLGPFLRYPFAAIDEANYMLAVAEGIEKGMYDDTGPPFDATPAQLRNAAWVKIETIKLEAFAQAGALFYNHPGALQRAAPRTYQLLKEVHDAYAAEGRPDERDSRIRSAFRYADSDVVAGAGTPAGVGPQSPSILESRVSGQGAVGRRRGPGTRQDPLIALHNMSAAEVEAAAKLGGLPVPSIAVLPPENEFNDFGDVTLVAPKSLVDPAEPYNEIYETDAYTPTFPRVQREVANKAKFAAIEREVDEVSKTMRPWSGADYGASLMQGIESDGSLRRAFITDHQRLHDQVTLVALYLKEQGEEVRIPMKYSDGWSRILDDVEVRKELRALKKRESTAENRDPLREEYTEIFKRHIRRRYEGIDEEDGRKGRKEGLVAAFIENATNEDGLLDGNMYHSMMKDHEDVLAGRIKRLDTAKLETQLVNRLKRRDKGFEKYNAWVEEKFEGVLSEPFIMDGRRKVAPSLDNIVKVMTRGSTRSADEGIFFGLGQARAMGAKRLTNMKQVRAQRERMVPKDKQEAAAERVKDRFFAWKDDMARYTYMDNPFTVLDELSRSLGQAGKGRISLRQALSRNGFNRSEVPDYLIEKGQSIMRAMKEVPIEYLEAKPQRAVRFDEFVGAVVPYGDKKTAETLKSLGITRIRYYKKWDAADRSRAIHGFRAAMFALGERPVRGGLSVQEARRELALAMGEEAAENLLRRGRLRVVADMAELRAAVGHIPGYDPAKVVRGYYDPHTGISYIVAGNTPRGKVYATALHEVGAHYGFPDLMGRDFYDATLARLRDLYANGEEAVVEAHKRAVSRETPEAALWDEVLAYLVENPANHAYPKTLSGLIEAAVAKIRAFLARIGWKGADTLSVRDMAEIAKGAVRREARRERGPRMRRVALGSAAANDRPNLVRYDDGRPVRVYHGTTTQRTEGREGRNIFFFTDSPHVANQYAMNAQPGEQTMMRPGWPPEGAFVMPANLVMENPLEVDGAMQDNTQVGMDAIVDRALAEGHDGVIVRNVDDAITYEPMGGNISDVYVVFDPEQIVPAPGRTATAAPLFYSQMRAHLAEKLPGRAPANQYAKTVQTFADKGQFKAEELAWSGLVEWLQEQGTARVTKQQVLDYLDDNAVEVQETILLPEPDEDALKIEFTGDFEAVEPSDEFIEAEARDFYLNDAKEEIADNEGIDPAEVDEDEAMEVAKRMAWESWESDPDKETYQVVTAETPSDVYYFKWHSGGDGINTLFGEEGKEIASDANTNATLDQARVEAFIRDHLGEIGAIPMAEDGMTANWGGYTRGGGTNYRELVLSLPQRVDVEAMERSQALMEELRQRREALADEFAKGDFMTREYADHLVFLTETDRLNGRERDLAEEAVGVERFEEMSRELRGIYEGMDRAKKLAWRSKFQSDHIPIENTLAHARVDDRTGPNGERVLFVNEVQSDWHQEGASRGYRGDGPQFEVIEFDAGFGVGEPMYRVVRIGTTTPETVDQQKAWFSREAAERALAKREEQQEAGLIPDAPFKKSWPLVTMKAILRHAVENGYDMVAWPSSAVQVADIESWETVPLEDDPRWRIVRRYTEDMPRMLGKYLKRWGGKVSIARLDEGKDGYMLKHSYVDFLTWLEEDVPGEYPGIDSEADYLQSKGEAYKRFDEEWTRNWMDMNVVEINDKMRESVMEAQPMFALEQAGSPQLDLPAEGTKDFLLRRIQDKFRRVLVAQRHIEGRFDTALPDELNVYQKEMIMYGKAENDILRLEEDYVEPLVEALQREGVDIDELDAYLEARHAPERNAWIQQINPRFREDGGGSGMTDEEAAAHMEGLSRAKREKLERVAAWVDGMNERRLEVWEEAGLESQEYIDELRTRYEHYVPLIGFVDEDGAAQTGGRPRLGGGMDIRGKESKRALGRRSRAASPTLNSILALEAAHIRARKAEVGRTLKALIEEFPDDSVWKVVEVPGVEWKKPRYDERLGEVVYGPDPFKKLADDVLGVKENGKQYYLHLKDPLIARAMKNLGEEKARGLIGVLSRLNRYLAMINTSLSPEFVLSNMTRDIQTALFNLLDEQEGGLAGGQRRLGRKVMKSIPAAIRGAYRGLTNKDATDFWATMMHEYMEAGGKVGFFGLQTIEVKRKKLEAMLKEAQGGFAGNSRRIFRQIENLVMDANAAVENAARLAAYVYARGYDPTTQQRIHDGLSKDKAAALAKNLTVNFNKKGELGTLSNAMYLFFNAGLQGSARLVQATVRSKRVRQALAGVAVGAFMLAELNRMIAGDDDDGENFYDKIADWERERNLILMKPDGSYYKFPLPYGYNMPFVLGETINRVLHGRNKTKAAIHVIDTFLASFNPLGTEDSEQLGNRLLKMVSPTILDPMVSLQLNENFYGGPIAPENFPFGGQKPDAELYFSTVSPMAKDAAQLMNRLTGGNPMRSGWVDVSPESIEHIANFMFGSAGRFVRQAAEFPVIVASPEPIQYRQVPFIRRFRGEQSEWHTNSVYWENKEKVDQLYYERKYFVDSNIDTKDFDKEYKHLLDLRPVFQRAEKELRRLRKRRNSIRADRTISDSVRAKMLKNVNSQIEAKQKAVNRKYNEVVE